MLTETQSLLFQTIPLAIILAIGIYNLTYPKLKIKELSILFTILCAGLLIGRLYFVPFILVSILFTFIYLYLIRRSTPIILLILPISYIVATICRNLISVLLIHMLAIDNTTIQHSTVYCTLYTIIYMITYYIFTYLLGIFTAKWFFHENTALSHGTLGMIFTNLILCCVLLLANVFASAKIGYTSESITSLKEYTANLEQVYNSLRSFKHDYVNIMASISSYLDEKHYDDLYEYFHSNIVPLQKELMQNTDTLNNLMHIKQLEVKSLLSYKMIYAIEKNIQVVIDIPDDIEHVNMKPVDFVRVLGIYLDNAIEAALETAAPKVNLHFANMDTYIVLIISNSFVDKNLPISKMCELYATTKGEKHGIGLYNANSILMNYPSVFHETYIENGLFFQHIQIAN